MTIVITDMSTAELHTLRRNLKFLRLGGDRDVSSLLGAVSDELIRRRDALSHSDADCQPLEG